MKQIYVSSVPSQFVNNVLQVAEVYQMNMVKAQKSVDKDVMIINPLGQSALIDRMSLVTNFLSLSGKPIKMISLRYGKKYTVMRTKKTNCLAVEVPKNDKIKFVDASGNSVPGGKILILPAEGVEIAGDSVDFTEAKPIDKSLFKKLYRITKLSDALMERLNIASEVAKEEKSKADTERSDASVGVEQAAKVVTSPDDYKVDWGKEKLDTVQRKVELASVTALIKDGNGSLVGYRLTIGGRLKDVTPKELARMANANLVDNVKFVPRNGDRKAYVAGVGIKLSELPVIPVGF